MGLVRWAEGQIGVVERDRSWLDAQELLYLLRTFYEDTERTDAFNPAAWQRAIAKINACSSHHNSATYKNQNAKFGMKTDQTVFLNQGGHFCVLVILGSAGNVQNDR